MERETGIDDRAKNAPEGGLEDCGWRVACQYSSSLWKDIDMENSCPGSRREESRFVPRSRFDELVALAEDQDGLLTGSVMKKRAKRRSKAEPNR